MADHQASRAKSQPKKHKIYPWIIGLLVLLFGLVVSIGICGAKLYSQAQEVKTHEMNALRSLSAISNVSSVDAIGKVNENLSTIQKETTRSNEITHTGLWDFAAKMPFVGKDIATVQGMTKIVDDLVQDTVPQFLKVVDSLQKADLSAGEGVNLQPIVGIQQELEQANDSLQKNVKRYNSLGEPNIEQIAGAYNQGKDQLDSLATKVDSLSNTMKILPGLLGEGHSRTYAVMAMTTSEMRSAGGLIGSVGEMTADNGNVNISDFRANSDYLQYGSADYSPDEKRVFVDQGPLHMSFDIRDIAVFPETQRTADAMRTIWNRTPWGSEHPLDGIIMVDPVFVQQLVKVTGNVTLADGTVLTGDNTAEFLLNTVYKKYPEELTNMVFGAAATEVLNNAFKGLTLQKLSDIAQIMQPMAKERHFNIYVFDESLEKEITAAGFTSSIPESETNPQLGIYLNEQNPSKMGWYIRRSSRINEVSRSPNGNVTYRVEYSLSNVMTSEEAQDEMRYITGMNADARGKGMEKILFYPPAGGEIDSISLLGEEGNTVQKTTIDGKMAYVSYVVIDPGQTKVFSLDVTTSPEADGKLTIDQTPQGR